MREVSQTHQDQLRCPRNALNLRLGSQERSPVRGISGAAFVDPDGFSILDVPNIAVELDVDQSLRPRS
jgi:hypothetical protein